jgi:hypothetical protein
MTQIDALNIYIVLAVYVILIATGYGVAKYIKAVYHANKSK